MSGLPDVITEGLDVVFCGINPGERAAAAGHHFVGRGPQSSAFGGATAWILPNPSGRNRGFSLEALVYAYRALRLAAIRG